MHNAARQPSPITQLRRAGRAKLSLAVGLVLGAFVPLATSTVVHTGHLVDFMDERFLLVSRWLLVLGGLTVSAKTVYHWFLQTFRGDWSKALGYVLLIEGVLLLSPVPWLGHAALGLLIFINAFWAGSNLADAERADAALAALSEPIPAVVPEPVPQPLPAPKPIPLPPPLPSRPRPLQVDQVSPLPAPRPAQPATPKPDDQQPERLRYERAVAFAATATHLSAEMLKVELRCRQSAASSILSQLEADGIVGPPDPRNRGKRPVLQRAN